MRAELPIKSSTRAQVLMLAGSAFVVVFILWQISAWTNILYPIRLFVTFVHEAGHGLTAVLTGGRWESFQVMDNGAGVAFTAGGSRFLVLQMGYLGAALFGAILLYTANRAQRVDVVAAVVGLIFVICAIFFTGNGLLTVLLAGGGILGMWLLAEKYREHSTFLRVLAVLGLVLTVIVVRSELALVVGLVGGIGLMALGVMASRSVTIFVLNMLAFLTGFNAINDIWSLMSNRFAGIGSTPNDALALAQYTNTPVELWIVLWAGLAVLMMGASIYLALIRPRE
jgi:Peptidase M50B-like